MKILVVEDEVYSRKSLVKQVRELTQAMSPAILEATNGQKALELIMSEHPTLVLSDIKMPFMNGLELLKEVRQKSPQTNMVMISGYADFQFAQQALNEGAIGYLLKPVSDESLQDCFVRFLKKKESQTKQEDKKANADKLALYLKNCIEENRADENFIIEKTFSRVLAPYRMVSITFTMGNYPEKVVFQQQLKNMLEHTVGVEFRILILSNRRWEIVMKNTAAFSGMLRRLESFLEQQELSYCVGISGVHRKLTEVLVAHAEAVNAEKYRLLEVGSLFSFERLRTVHTKNSSAFPEYEELQLQLKKGDADCAYVLMRQHLLMMQKDPTFTVESYENLLMKLQVLLSELSGDRKSKVGQEWFSLLTYTGFDELLAAVKQQIYDSCKEIRRKKQNVEDSVPDRVIEYIHENYQKDLSLKDLAERVFFMNHSYLSYLIRQKTGKTYSSYLREIRIDHAKGLLKDSHLSITDIATLCGYNDPSQFIQTFKKEVGATPRRFREQTVRTDKIDR